MTYQKIVVPIDHGNRNLKTENFVFTSGILESDCKPVLGIICIIMEDIIPCQSNVFRI